MRQLLEHTSHELGHRPATPPVHDSDLAILCAHNDVPLFADPHVSKLGVVLEYGREDTLVMIGFSNGEIPRCKILLHERIIQLHLCVERPFNSRDSSEFLV